MIMNLLDMQGMTRADACGFGCGDGFGGLGGFGGGLGYGGLGFGGLGGFGHLSCISICFCPELF
jgi:hypothetical protein